jgi:hypothetical protein
VYAGNTQLLASVSKDVCTETKHDTKVIRVDAHGIETETVAQIGDDAECGETNQCIANLTEVRRGNEMVNGIGD